MLATSDESLTNVIGRLRFGPLGKEHGPRDIALLIEDLMMERTALTLQLRAAEERGSRNVEANAYARGYRAAVEMAARVAVAEPHIREAIEEMMPSFREAASHAGQ